MGQPLQHGLFAQHVGSPPGQTHGGVSLHSTLQEGLASAQKVHPTLFALKVPLNPGGQVTVNCADTGAAIKHAATTALRQLIRIAHFEFACVWDKTRRESNYASAGSAHALHAAVGNPRLVELVADDAKSAAFVETDRMHLGV